MLKESLIIYGVVWIGERVRAEGDVKEEKGRGDEE